MARKDTPASSAVERCFGPGGEEPKDCKCLIGVLAMVFEVWEDSWDCILESVTEAGAQPCAARRAHALARQLFFCFFRGVSVIASELPVTLFVIS